jgi:hypothetical protein
MKFYSVVLKKKIEIPDANVKYVVRKGRNFAVGSYTAKGKSYDAWMTIAKNAVKKVKKK